MCQTTIRAKIRFKNNKSPGSSGLNDLPFFPNSTGNRAQILAEKFS